MVNYQQQSEELSEQDWIKKEHGTVLDYGSRNLLDIAHVIQADSAVLPPIVAVWLVESRINAERFWVITGDVPNDHIPGNNAKNARDAIRHFSLRWQLKADRILASFEEADPEKIIDDSKKEFAELLVSRANSLYELSEMEEYWQ